jgi:hypothetical protein
MSVVETVEPLNLRGRASGEQVTKASGKFCSELPGRTRHPEQQRKLTSAAQVAPSAGRVDPGAPGETFGQKCNFTIAGSSKKRCFS